MLWKGYRLCLAMAWITYAVLSFALFNEKSRSTFPLHKISLHHRIYSYDSPPPSYFHSTSSTTLHMAKRRTILGKNKRQSDSDSTILSPNNDSNNSSNNSDNSDSTETTMESKIQALSSMIEEDIQEFVSEPGFRQEQQKLFLREQERQVNMELSKQKNKDIFKPVKDAVSFLLIVDFFVVIGFLLWFLLAVALKTSNPVVLEKFQDIFNPIVVPSLTVLMVGSIASGLLGPREKE